MADQSKHRSTEHPTWGMLFCDWSALLNSFGAPHWSEQGPLSAVGSSCQCTVCVWYSAAEELGIPNSKLVVYFTTADIFKNTLTRFSRQIILFGLTGIYAYYFWMYYSLKLYAVNNSSRPRGFQRPTGRRDALRLGITGVLKDSQGAKKKKCMKIQTATDIFRPYHSVVTITSDGY